VIPGRSPASVKTTGHGDATAAAAAAAAHAEAAGGGNVLVHDRYHHVHLTHRDRRPSGATQRRSP
jgi:hypothetical protein